MAVVVRGNTIERIITTATHVSIMTDMTPITHTTTTITTRDRTVKESHTVEPPGKKGTLIQVEEEEEEGMMEDMARGVGIVIMGRESVMKERHMETDHSTITEATETIMETELLVAEDTEGKDRIEIGVMTEALDRVRMREAQDNMVDMADTLIMEATEEEVVKMVLVVTTAEAQGETDMTETETETECRIMRDQDM